MAVTAQHILEAEARIRPYIAQTELLHSSALSDETGSAVYLKLENHQVTGSFKARGAVNKVLSLDAIARQRGIITASTGNHGLGTAYALGIAGVKGKIYVPVHAKPAKLHALQKYPVEIIQYGNDSLETELFAKQAALDTHSTWISPYNDPQIIAGQGTIGYELTDQLENISAVYVTVGGGGLISGIATWLSEYSPDTQIIGCLPENSPEMKLSVEAGYIVQMPEAKPTLSDGSAGGLEEGSITFPICRELVHRYLLVTEAEIAAAMDDLQKMHNQHIEGAAGVAIAAMRLDRKVRTHGRVVVIVCGGNVEKRTS